ncbi:MAG: hypothetical protein Kow0069_15170 [Promethearchaeota archaeon]
MAAGELDGFVLYGTPHHGSFELDLELLRVAGCVAALVHGADSDRGRPHLERGVALVRDAGLVPGAATHRPNVTLRWVLELDLDCPLLLVPCNPLGYAMGDREETLALVREARRGGRVVVAMKVLAGGRVGPNEGLRFVASVPVDGVTLGLVESEQARQTVELAAKLFP